MNKRWLRVLLCALIVAVTGQETQRTIMMVLGQLEHRTDFRRQHRPRRKREDLYLYGRLNDGAFR